MPVTAKKLSPEWRKAFEEYEHLTGFEVLDQDLIDKGECTPRDAWEASQRWFYDLYGSVSNIKTPEEGEE